MVVITSVVLVSNGRFGGVVQLESLTYDVALSIRQAQVYGISVARFGADTFSAGYGVHFDISNPDTYEIFADAITENGLFDCPAPGTDNCERVQTTTIAGGYSIHNLCVLQGDDLETCNDVQKFDILFVRPEPDAWVSASDTPCFVAGVPQGEACLPGARITLISPRGDTMSVVVEANGQISVRRAGQ